MSAAGLTSVGHPLLGAAVTLAGGDGCVFTAQLSLASHPWLADHAVMGVVLLPGTAFLELAMHVGSAVGCPVVRELTLESPLVLDEDAGVQVQVVVGERGADGERSVAVYARTGRDGSEGELDWGSNGESEGGWQCHASGALLPDESSAGVDGSSGAGEWRAVDSRALELAGVWPPAGAEPLEIDDAYERLEDVGLEYGPVFQGLRGVWRRGEEVFAEVELGEEQAGDAGSFGVHPALLDSALHASALVALEGASGLDGG